MGQMAVMDGTGDTKVVWDPTKQDEVDAAKATFNSLRKKKYKAFAVLKDGEPGHEISEFDPTAGKIIMVPPMAGG